MRYIRKYIIGSLALPLLLLSCTDNGLTVSNPSGGSASGSLVRMELNISTPEAFSTRNSTRAITEECDSTLDGRFAVFGFTYDDSGDAILQFVLKTGEMPDDDTLYSTGDTNAESNLNGENTYVSSYGDYTTSPSIAWHAADESSTRGRLYIEYWETPGPVHLLVLSNVDSTKVAALLTEDETTGEPAITIGESTLDEVTEALAPALDFSVYDDEETGYTINSIPMAAECELANGITLGSTGSISLRRSVAKFTVRVEYTGDRIESYGTIADVPFHPQSLQILNVNSYATVYAPNSSEPNISTLNESTIDLEYTFPGAPTSDESVAGEEWEYDADEDVYYKEVVFYVAETMNSKKDARTATGDGSYTTNTDDPRISVLVIGEYIDYTDQTNITTNCYRLDLIPEGADDLTDELDSIMRNHHYKFVISDASKRGSSSVEEALEMAVPDNEPNIGLIGSYVIIDDEDILSITVETSNTTEGGRGSYYVGVSSTSIELDVAQGTSACARVKMVTNADDWSIDFYSIPQATDENGDPLTDSDGNTIYAITFVWDSNSSTLWLWLDYPESVTVGETYAYYIVAGNIRKKMRITIVDSSETDEEEPS